MNYQTFLPHPELEALVKCHWTLEVPAGESAQRQRILPDGCIELIFILGDDIKRIISETEYTLQPRSMAIGQITEPFFIEPTGYVNSFAVRFYPYGFANFVTVPLESLSDKETPIAFLFGEIQSNELQTKIIQATDTRQRIDIVEAFLLDRLKRASTVDGIVKDTVGALLQTNGSASIGSLLKDDVSKRRQLERKFLKQIGVSPKQLGKVIRLQTALKLLLQSQAGNLTSIAYESDYYDQAHFIKDFKEFTGINPKEFLGNDAMKLSSLFYKEA